MPVFYFVRHAHAHWTPDIARPLSARGRAAAQQVADLLAPQPIGAIYASPERRARQTVEPLAGRLALPITETTDLRERLLSTTPVEDFEQAVRACWDDASFSHPGGESNLAAQQRGLAVIRAIIARELPTNQAHQIVIATHGNLMALILQAFDPAIGFDFWRSLTMPDIYRLEVIPGERPSRQRVWPATGN